ncbi:ABC transporter permease (plasmid) [Sinorhizobium sp. B11]|jgi:peptide/nickel transport system permease protein|uniref:ABC transporter permease n=1 Tax=unclassified Rhizobium TaxID=2613769 RepID=UPI000DDB3BF8|nr:MULTISPECIES: ABC transporter permease [unclassified Rhizobium]MBB3445218.1 peptide/nickel transport system permease protein [Rhizobium sp. BK379]MBB3561291.1 peptide/nickel transport system permease protein [Rhizobium sp. BK512]
MFKILRDLLRYNREFLLGTILILIIVGLIVSSFFSPYDENAIYVVIPDMPPSAEFWFGTTSRGQDVFWQIGASLRNTLLFGIIVAVISRLIALVVGLVSGYIGGRTDQIIMGINDTLGALPNIPILLLLVFVLRDQMTWSMLAVVAALLGWTHDSRLIRSVALSLRQREFTRHAVFSGMRTSQILVREHLPYVMPIVFFTTMNNLIWAIGLEVTLSILGFSDINRPTIGGMIYWANAHSAMVAGIWWWVAFPMLFVVILFLGLFMLAMSVNEYIDPRSRLARMGA